MYVGLSLESSDHPHIINSGIRRNHTKYFMVDGNQEISKFLLLLTTVL